MKIKNEKSQVFKNLFKISAAILFVTAIMFVLNYLTPLYYDDYRYAFSFADGERMTSISQILPSMIAHHSQMNGRFVVHTLVQLFSIMNGLLFDVVNSIAFSLFILIIYYHGTGTFKSFKIGLFSICFLFIWIISPGFGESFLWLTGSANYLFGPIIGLLFLVPYTKYSNSCEMKNNRALSFIFAVLYLMFGAIAGCTNENLALCVFGIQILFIISFIITKNKLRLWMFSGVVGNIAGIAFMFSSPTYVKRSEIWSGNSSIYNMIRGFLLSISSFFESALFLLLAICIAVIIFMAAKKSNKLELSEIRTPVIFGLAAIAYVLSVFACDYYPDRAWSACIAFLVIVLCSLIARIKIGPSPKWVSCILFAFMLVSFFLGSYLTVYLELKSVKYAFDQREAIISQSLEEGKKTVELEAITTESQYSCYYGKGDIHVANWMKRELANYYGLEAVTEKETQK